MYLTYCKTDYFFRVLKFYEFAILRDFILFYELSWSRMRALMACNMVCVVYKQIYTCTYILNDSWSVCKNSHTKLIPIKFTYFTTCQMAIMFDHMFDHLIFFINIK